MTKKYNRLVIALSLGFSFSRSIPSNPLRAFDISSNLGLHLLGIFRVVHIAKHM